MKLPSEAAWSTRRLTFVVGELLVQQQAEVRELERDVDAQAALGDAVEDRLVLGGDRARLVRREDVLAEQRRVRVRGRSR